jgi:hypothetical protein
LSRTPSARARRVRGGILSLALGGVFALGAYAALGRLDLGPDEPVVRASNASLAERAAQLDTMEADLQAALAKDPPKLPPIPKYPPVKKPRVPKPRVVTLVSYAQDVTYERGKEKGKKYDDKKKHDEARKKREEQRKHEAEQRREERKKREEQRREERKKREEQKKHEEEKKP